MPKSKIFFYSCLFFILGIGIVSYLQLPLWAAFGIFIVGCGFLFVGWPAVAKVSAGEAASLVANHKRIFIIIGLGGIFLFFGMLRFTASTPVADKNQINFYNGEERTFVGIISAEPDTRDSGVKLKVKSERMRNPSLTFPFEKGENLDWRKVNGNVLVNVRLYPVFHYGDELEIKCELQKPEPILEFAYDKYLAKENIYSLCYWPEIKLLASGRGNKVIAAILFIKEKLIYTVNRILPEPQAAFLGGLLYGARRGIPKDLMEKFNITGTTHIIAISGYNITILAALLMRITRIIGIARKKSFWISLFGIFFFVILTGASASVVRAALMGCLVLLASQTGRASKTTNALVFAAAAMLFLNPKILAFDVGFQLSFAATAGLIFLTPVLEKYFNRWPSLFGVKESLITTLSAIIMTLPLILYNFGRISFIAPLANLLILPAIPLTMALGSIAVLGGLIYVGLGQVLAWLAWLFLSYIIKGVEILAKIPLASLEVDQIHWAFIIVIYFVIGGFIRKQQKKFTADDIKKRV
jgi:competence protein ComEC